MSTGKRSSKKKASPKQDSSGSLAKTKERLEQQKKALEKIIRTFTKGNDNE